MESPNIYKYATSELSQDAFFCWLFEWLNHRDSEMYGVALNLINIIDPIFEERNVNEVKINRQWKNIDFVLMLQSDTNPAFVFVEHKKYANLSGPEQLNKYLEKVNAYKKSDEFLKSVDENSVIPVFLKTGYDYDLPAPESYRKINYKTLEKWVNCIPDSTLKGYPILNDWVRYYKKSLNTIVIFEEAADRLLKGEIDVKNLSQNLWSAEFQYILWKKLFNLQSHEWYHSSEGQFRSYHFNRKISDVEIGHMMLQGTSSGRPWIQLQFYPKGRAFFYRLDWIGNKWTISCRYYKKNKDQSDFELMKQLSVLYNEAITGLNMQMQPFRNTYRRTESTFFQIELLGSKDLKELDRVHEKVMTRSFQEIEGFI